MCWYSLSKQINNSDRMEYLKANSLISIHPSLPPLPPFLLKTANLYMVYDGGVEWTAFDKVTSKFYESRVICVWNETDRTISKLLYFIRSSNNRTSKYLYSILLTTALYMFELLIWINKSCCSFWKGARWNRPAGMMMSTEYIKQEEDVRGFYVSM